MENKEQQVEKKKIPQWLKNLKRIIENNPGTKKESK